jgi:hypothetical protein
MISSENLGGERYNLHEILFTELPGHWAKDTGAARIGILINDHGCIGVKP